MVKQNDILIRVKVLVERARKQLTGIKKDMQNLAEEAKKSKIAFSGWALSLMFAGMALKRTFDTIWKSSTKTFQDVMHSVEGTVTGFDILQGSLAFLGFTVGSALEPLAMWLAPIIDGVSDWVMQNEDLVRGFVAMSGIIGTVLTTFGMLKLAGDGFAQAMKASGVFSATAGTGILFLAALAAVGMASWTAFSKTPDAWKAMKDSFASIADSGIIDTLGETFLDLIDSLLPGTQESLEDIAWTFAWLGTIGVEAFKLIASSVTQLTNLFLLGIEVIKKYFAALRDDEEGALKADRKIAAARARVDAANADIVDAALALKRLVTETPDEFRTRMETQQQYERKQAEASMIGGSGVLFDGEQFQVQPIEIIMDSEKVAEAVIPWGSQKILSQMEDTQ